MRTFQSFSPALAGYTLYSMSPVNERGTSCMSSKGVIEKPAIPVRISISWSWSVTPSCHECVEAQTVTLSVYMLFMYLYVCMYVKVRYMSTFADHMGH